MRALAIVLLAHAVLLSACGDDVPTPASTSAHDAVSAASGEQGDGGWSQPEHVAPGGGEAGPVSPAAMLTRVEAQVRAGTALHGATWGQDLAALADLLYPPIEDGVIPAEIGDLLKVLHTAGDVARWLTEGPEARLRLAQDRPIDLAMHDEALEAMTEGHEAFAAWVPERGAELFGEKMAWLQAQFEDR